MQKSNVVPFLRARLVAHERMAEDFLSFLLAVN
jgi:hypothetical protein